jgi:CheY-like chemotaxis protein
MRPNSSCELAGRAIKPLYFRRMGIRVRACHRGPAGVYSASANAMSEPYASSRESGGDKGLIYIVDDEPMLLEMASVILQPLGYQLRTYRDPEAALNAFVSARPRPLLVITDYAMHRLNGMDLIVGCRRAEPKQRILMVSGTVGPDIFRTAGQKPDGFLAKPYHAKLLIDAVKALLPN